MGRKKKSVDHLGNEYASIAEMCAAYPVGNPDAYCARIKKGMSIEDALITPITYLGKKTFDHLGNEYPSRRKMCKHYGISEGVFVTRTLKLLWDLEKALLTPVHDTEWLPVVGPDGKEYKNTSEMCKALNISRSAYDRRKNSKNQLDDTINMRTKHSCSDGLGNEFPTITAMCKHYNITRDIFYYRTNDLQMDVTSALTTPYIKALTSVKERIGEVHTANNGCEYIIIDAKNDTDVTVRFIDGEVVRTRYSTNIARGIVKHPTLKKVGTGTFAGFTTKPAFSDKSEVYYQCHCQTCDHRDIYTPGQMFEHYKKHEQL